MVAVVNKLRAVAEEVLRAHAQVFFSRRLLVGALLLAAAMTHPAGGVAGVLAVLLSSAVVRAARLSSDHAAQGLYGYNPLLLGLALGTLFEPSRGALVLAAVAVIAVVFLQSALENALGHLFNLPALSLPFVIVALAALALATLGHGLHPAAAEALPDDGGGLAGFLSLYLRSLGAIFFSPTLVAGALVLSALVSWSRIAAVLSLLGFSVGQFVIAQVGVDSPMAPLVVGYNGAFAAIALGGVWFVPQRSGFVLGAVAALLASFFTMAALALLSPLHLPVLILPFNLCMLVALHAMRQRVADGAPKAVDFAAGTPEENLAYWRTRLLRFGGGMPVRLQLPFFGRWTVTQGIDGGHTHQGAWRHALDFEVADREGRRFAGAGTALKDYFCYRLPVFAAAAGTVVNVVNDAPDNGVGERTNGDPWGNRVVIQHAVGLYSLVAHLAPGSVEVVVGQVVAAGARLGLCGNSGRSFVPHLHFQLQSSPVVGAPTRALELHDVVVEAEGAAPSLRRVHVPREGEALRNVERREEVAALVAFPLGGRMTFQLTDEHGRSREERISSGIDLYNNLFLESNSTRSRLYYDLAGRQLLLWDYQGAKESVLHLLAAAAPRVPLEPGAGLRWDDVLSRRLLRPRAAGFLLDFIEPFLPAPSQADCLEYVSSREGESLVVRGRGRRVETLARFVPGTGLCELALVDGKKRKGARLVRHEMANANEEANGNEKAVAAE